MRGDVACCGGLRAAPRRIACVRAHPPRAVGVSARSTSRFPVDPRVAAEQRVAPPYRGRPAPRQLPSPVYHRASNRLSAGSSVTAPAPPGLPLPPENRTSATSAPHRSCSCHALAPTRSPRAQGKAWQRAADPRAGLSEWGTADLAEPCRLRHDRWRHPRAGHSSRARLPLNLTVLQRRPGRAGQLGHGSASHSRRSALSCDASRDMSR